MGKSSFDICVGHFINLLYIWFTVWWSENILFQFWSCWNTKNIKILLKEIFTPIIKSLFLLCALFHLCELAFISWQAPWIPSPPPSSSSTKTVFSKNICHNLWQTKTQREKSKQRYIHIYQSFDITNCSDRGM